MSATTCETAVWNATPARPSPSAVPARGATRTEASPAAHRTKAVDFLVELLWVFAICSVAGLVIEEIAYMVSHGGAMQDRAGLVFGPFSPIYGVGGVAMTVTVRCMGKLPLPAVFLACALVGGAFEFLTSWLMETFLGITAWDYTGTWLSVDGRTNGEYMIIWGLLGVVWLKAVLPLLQRLIYAVPARQRIAVTVGMGAFLLVDAVLTVEALNCWYLRAAGDVPDTALQLFCAQHFDDAFMEGRFQTMTLSPGTAARQLA